MKLRQQESQTLARSFGLTFHEPRLVPNASPDWHQLVIAARSLHMVESQSTTWLVEKGTGLWLPAGVGCTLVGRGQTSVRMLYLPVSEHFGDRFSSGAPVALSVSPLLTQLIERVVALGALTKSEPSQIRLAHVIKDEIQQAKQIAPSLVHPSSQVLTQLIAEMEKANFELGAFAQLIKTSGFSRRTIERSFVTETGQSAGSWLKKRRLLAAIEMLATGDAVDDVSFRLGYKSSSGFIAMFKSQMGIPPGEFVRKSESQ